VERRGQAIRVMINKANWQQEEPTGCGGGRQLSMDGTSRVTGDCHARFCERLGVKFPGATRRRSAMAVPTATQCREAALKGERRDECRGNDNKGGFIQVRSPFSTRECQIQCKHSRRDLGSRRGCSMESILRIA
jgi:hypothetical protein